MSRTGHASSRAALIYQLASEERDQAIAMAPGKMVNPCTKLNRSRHEITGSESGGGAKERSTRGNYWSGRPGSNRHDQLGRLVGALL